MPVRRGMTLLQRQKLREEVLRRHLKVAQQRAAEYGVSVRCREALAAALQRKPSRARELHKSCTGETTGRGCLCTCHDVRDTAVATGCSG